MPQMTIHKYTDLATPSYVVFLKFGNMPQQTETLAAKTDSDAIYEVRRRFGREGVIVQ